MRTMQWMRVAAAIAMSVPLTAFAQTTRTTPLNRTVIVRPNAATAVPVECEEGLAPQPQPRVTEQERQIVIPPAPVMEAPPSADLRSTLAAAVEAAQNNDRAAFEDRLAAARRMLASYPTGGERTAAFDVVAVLDDIHTLWAYEFSSPTGAFFDASSDIFRMLVKYPGYEPALRRQVLVDRNGTRFYPSRESRDFLAGEAAARLSRLTGRPVVKTPAPRVVQTAPAPAPAPKIVEQHKPAPAPRKAEHRTVTHKHATTATTHKKPVTKVAKAAPPKSKPVPHPAKAPAPAPAPPPVTASTAAPVATSSTPPPPTTRTAAPQPPPATASTSTAMSESAPPPTATATTASQATPQQTPPASHGNLIIPIILIILGVGVLVLFSRSSSA